MLNFFGFSSGFVIDMLFPTLFIVGPAFLSSLVVHREIPRHISLWKSSSS